MAYVKAKVDKNWNKHIFKDEFLFILFSPKM